jgi:type VI secretion system secreted protein VgrG
MSNQFFKYQLRADIMKMHLKRFTPIVIVVVAATSTLTGVASSGATGPAGSVACAGSTAIKATTVELGSARGFSVFAGAAITNVGRSFINGEIGVDPGTAITGNETIFSNGTATGIAAEIKVQTHLVLPSLIAANTEITRQKVVNGFSPIAAELGAQVVCPGIYKSDAAFGLTGNLTLDGNNNPNSLFIFITPAAITTAAASKIILVNGAQEKNVFWQSGAAATLGASSFFKGTILAEAAITAGNGVHVHGRLLSKSAAVTLDRDCVVVPDIATDIVCSTE